MGLKGGRAVGGGGEGLEEVEFGLEWCGGWW